MEAASHQPGPAGGRKWNGPHGRVRYNGKKDFQQQVHPNGALPMRFRNDVRDLGAGLRVA
jgi:hypothetical protein